MALFGDADSKKLVGLVEKLERRVQTLESEVRTLKDEVQRLRSSAVPVSAFPTFSPPAVPVTLSPPPSTSVPPPGSEAGSLDDRMRADAEVMGFVRDNQKINAIRRVRELTRLPLKEAKDLVERLY